MVGLDGLGVGVGGRNTWLTVLAITGLVVALVLQHAEPPATTEEHHGRGGGGDLRAASAGTGRP